jgi:hypothetical protein
MTKRLAVPSFAHPGEEDRDPGFPGEATALERYLPTTRFQYYRSLHALRYVVPITVTQVGRCSADVALGPRDIQCPRASASFWPLIRSLRQYFIL